MAELANFDINFVIGTLTGLVIVLLIALLIAVYAYSAITGKNMSAVLAALTEVLGKALDAGLDNAAQTPDRADDDRLLSMARLMGYEATLDADGKGYTLRRRGETPAPGSFTPTESGAPGTFTPQP